MTYDPLVPPDPEDWLAMPEAERIDEVVEYHRRQRVALPSARLHAAMHVTVETQLAERLAATTGTIDRLMAAGVSRHAAIHAIASVVAAQMRRILRENRPFDQAGYEQDLAALTAEDWMDGAT